MSEVEVQVIQKKIPTYSWADCEELPMFAKNRIHQRLSGNPYPNPVVNQVRRDTITDREYTVIVLENEFIKLEILPEIGGRIFSAQNKKNGYDFFYRQHVIKPALIGMLGLWVSGGLEFNWPVHHNPAGFFPVEYHVETQADGTVIVWLGSRDLLDRIEGQLGISISPGKAFFETIGRITNINPLAKSFMWWENAAVPVNESYEIFFPHDVSYVDFHYKKTRGAYPVMNSFFNTMDNRGGNDIRKHKNTTSATSYFSGVTKGDFFGGWDGNLKSGVIHYAPHTISTGAKMFTWGYGQMEKAWEKALTDTDGPYAELMASSYSDNQPDLSWIEPYETKEFSQYWYPYTDIGTVDCANLFLAVKLLEGKLLLYPVQTIEGAMIHVEAEKVKVDLIASNSVEISISGMNENSLITVTDSKGKVILKYRKPENSQEIPHPETDFPYPDKIKDASGCYLTGVHVAQYRDPKVDCKPYFIQGLKLQWDFWPCMVGLSQYYLEKFQFNDAEEWAGKAIDVLTRYNANPRDTEAYTLLGISLKEQKRYDEAYEVFGKAIWSQDQIAKAGLMMAQIDCIRHDYEKAEEHIEWLLKYGGQNLPAEELLIVIYRKLGKGKAHQSQIERCLRLNPFDLLALHEKGKLDLNDWKNNALRTAIDLAEEYADAGFMDEAVAVLQGLKTTSPILPILISCFNEEQLDTTILSEEPCFPSSRWELSALKRAVREHPDNHVINLLLGDLLYGKCEDENGALSCFRKAGFSVEALRNLAVVIYHIDSADPESIEIMENLVKEHPGNLQLIYEYQILCFLKEKDPEEILKFWEDNRVYTSKRDDIYIQGIHAANLAGKNEYALKLLSDYEFTPCEGGEHAVADEYLVAKREIGKIHYREKKYKKALSVFKSALTIPQNLGGGVWHQVKLAPFWYYIGLCYRDLGNGIKAKENFNKAVSFPVDYFTDMYDLSYRFYRGKALFELGEKEEGRNALSELDELLKAGLIQKDYGYFAATPFFDCFIAKPEEARKKFYLSLRDLCYGGGE
ncbi:MAG: hypothetical protein B6241_09975 [Spirochaetaceae bacterium 4572_59]|nr:MAG: hypothetical protein B6241_09975 [Spirochaetaceae bacterium 4572_59]